MEKQNDRFRNRKTTRISIYWGYHHEEKAKITPWHWKDKLRKTSKLVILFAMLRAILNKSWRQHPTRHQQYGHLPPITKTIQVRRTCRSLLEKQGRAHKWCTPMNRHIIFFFFFFAIFFIYVLNRWRHRLLSISYRSYWNQTLPIKWNAVSPRQRSCRYCYMDALLGC